MGGWVGGRTITDELPDQQGEEEEANPSRGRRVPVLTQQAEVPVQLHVHVAAPE